MYQTISEPIAVLGVYNHGNFVPRKLKWKQRVLKVDQITMCNDLREGQTRKRLYSVVCKGTVYRVLFNRDRETWTLEEIWVE